MARHCSTRIAHAPPHPPPGNGLRLLGLRTLNAQFLFSYALIFLFAAISAASLYLSFEGNAAAINIGGRQRMLSQRMVKEAMMVRQDLETAAVDKSVELFESSHRQLMQGDRAKGIAAPSEAVQAKLKEVEALWTPYHHALDAYLQPATARRCSNCMTSRPA